MKVHQEERGTNLAVERTDSEKSKLFKWKLAVKSKSKMDNRKSAPAETLSADVASDDSEKFEHFFSVMRLLAVTHMMRTDRELVLHQHHVKTVRGDRQPPLEQLCLLTRVEIGEFHLIQP